MRKIVDSNQLQTPRLRAYLAKSKSNFAVLTDYAAMEAYQGNTLNSIYKSMEVLCDYPKQVIVLKHTNAVCGLSGRGAGLQKRLIDEEQTLDFSDYASDLVQAKNGHVLFQRKLLAYGKDATDQIEHVLGDARTMAPIIEEIASQNSKEERRSLRMRQRYTQEIIDKVMQGTMQIAAKIFASHPAVQNWPRREELPNTFVFRTLLCSYLLALDWAARGGVKDATPEKLRNDLIDMNFAAYATFFDGLLSTDTKLLRIHDEARLWLSVAFGCHLHTG